jgi:hypothetical protein
VLAVGVCGAAVSAACAAALLLPGNAAAAAGPQATARLIDLSYTEVPALNVHAYAGVYGVASSPPRLPSDPGNFSDPDGVLQHVTLSGPVIDQTSLDSVRATAQSHLTAFDVMLRDSVTGRGIVLLTARSLRGLGGASVDDYAECILPPLTPQAFAYARIPPGTMTVLHTPIALPGTTDVPFTGAEVGRPGVGDGTLHVVVTRTQQPDSASAVAGMTEARAGWQVKIDVDAKDTSGKEIYDGPLMDLKLGQVTATCPKQPPTTPPTPPTPPTTPTTIPPTTAPTTPPTPPTPPTTTPPTPPTTPPTTVPTPPTTPPTTATSGRTTSVPSTATPAVPTSGSTTTCAGGGSSGNACQSSASRGPASLARTGARSRGLALAVALLAGLGALALCAARLLPAGRARHR